MQCKCGSHTTSHKVVRDKQTVGTFDKCASCGRVEKSPSLIEFLKTDQQFDKVENN